MNIYSWKFISNFLAISFILSIIGGIIIFFNENLGFFNRKIIDKKYCYILNNSNKYEMVISSSNLLKAIDLYKFYDRRRKTKNDFLGIFGSDYCDIPNHIKVDVLRYTKDGLFAYIRATYKTKDIQYTSIDKGYVPRFTLYDTLPRCYPYCFEKIPDFYIIPVESAEDFNNFYNRFYSDKKFQLNRIFSPLKDSILLIYKKDSLIKEKKAVKDIKIMAKEELLKEHKDIYLELQKQDTLVIEKFISRKTRENIIERDYILVNGIWFLNEIRLGRN